MFVCHLVQETGICHYQICVYVSSDFGSIALNTWVFACKSLMHLMSFPVYLAGASFHNHWINIFQSVTRIIQVSRYSLFAEPWQKTVRRHTCYKSNSSSLLSDLLWITWAYTGCMLVWVGMKEDFKKLKHNITIHDKFEKYSDNVNDFSWSESCLMPQERPKKHPPVHPQPLHW